MRVLCLHGMGTNSGILETQTEMFRSLLPSHFEYEFYDAEHDYPAAEGCEIFPGPYYCFYPIPTTSNVELAHEYVQDIIDEEGPFDAVMGFSQGAALAASVLLRHAKEKPNEPAPFRFAIFICGSLPYWFETSQGVDVAGLFLGPSDTPLGSPVPLSYQPTKDDGSEKPKPMVRSAPVQQVGKSAADIESLERRFSLATLTDQGWSRITPVKSSATESGGSSEWDSDSEVPEVFSPGEPNSGVQSPFSCLDDSDCEGSDWEQKSGSMDADDSSEHAVRRLHPASDTLRICIPTCHIYGSKDPYYRQSLGLAGLCDAQWTSTYEHPEGHIVPRAKDVNVKIAAAIEQTLRNVEVFQI